ncbi:MAG: glucosamine-6-phosphate deaminase [Alphaproteobacteria bacterium]|nr:glucosamine-6-phosphate deaminase [Alphaproteobacteria bacterium]
MHLEILPDKKTLGAAAAKAGAGKLRAAIARKGKAGLILATGASQFDVLDALVRADDIDWSRVTVLHLDEYIAMPATHPASFRRYLNERFVSRVPRLGAFIGIEGDAPDLAGELARVNTIARATEIDLCFAGIGENCHLAFNDPPADFTTEVPFIVVRLDDACRRQQFGEGWFPTLDAVPDRAISMSIQHMMKSKAVILSVPDARKADAVRAAVEGPVSPDYPASIMQQHPDCTIFLDPPAAAKLKRRA